jgi:nitroreductase
MSGHPAADLSTMTPPTPPTPSARRALEQAAELALLAPSVHNTQPWRVAVHDDRLELRVDRTRQLGALDPRGRELVMSGGAALLNARVALAAAGWGADCVRLPDPADSDLLAVLRPVVGTPDSGLALLAPAVPRRHSNRRAFRPDRLPEDVLRSLTHLVAEEDAVLVPVSGEANRRLLARLTRQADGLQNADPAYRAELRRWTTRPPDAGDGVPVSAVPHVDGVHPDDLPIRDFDTRGAGQLPAETRSGVDQDLVLLATYRDERIDWLRAGEAMERLLLELTALGWVASPMTQPIEVPVTRTQLRSALTWNAHPQMLLRIGHAAPTPRTPRRPAQEVVAGGRPPARPVPASPAPHDLDDEQRPVSDGRGGTVWE